MGPTGSAAMLAAALVAGRWRGVSRSSGLATRAAGAAVGKLSTFSITASAVHGCQGEYIEVTAAPMHGKPVRGWTFKGCAMQLTTCDSGGMTE